MKKVYVVLTVVLSAVATMLSGCALTVNNKIDKVKKIPVNGDYILCSSLVACKGEETTEFVEIVYDSLKENGIKPAVSDNNARVGGLFIDDKYYFKCKYSNEGVGTRDEYGLYPEYEFKFAIGVIDLSEFTVNVIRTAEFTEDKYYSPYDLYGVDIFEKNGKIFFSVFNNFLLSLDSATGQTEEYSAKGINKSYITDEWYAAAGVGGCITVSPSGAVYKTKTAAPQDYELIFSADYCLLFSEFGDYDKTNCIAIDCRTGEFTDEEEMMQLENSHSLLLGKYKGYPIDINGITYYAKAYRESIEFSKDNDEVGFTLNISDLREKSDEFVEIEAIFEKELYFGGVVSGNGEIYIYAKNDESFFGLYSGASVTACFLYDFENRSFEYIGWLPVYSSLSYVVKL